ncbi:MAG: class I SAM-dependent methyltransferase [Litorimonas sp.]
MSPLRAYTPPLRYHRLTPLYDGVIALLTRERTWRTELVRQIDPSSTDFIVDVGSGTGSLALALREVDAEHIYLGIDPDIQALVRARKKLSAFKEKSVFQSGYLTSTSLADYAAPTKIVSSLVLHQVTLDEKSKILALMYSQLSPGGTCIIADYGHQKTRVEKILFRLTVQALDGVEDTQPNADGVIPQLMQNAGFTEVEQTVRIATPTGTISIYRGSKTLQQDGSGA